jgi:hypothetical protein
MRKCLECRKMICAPKNGAVSANDYANDLVVRGYTVIPSHFDTTRLREQFDVTLMEFPEYIRQENVAIDKYVMGGFSALCNASSFHNPFVRALRQWSMAMLVPILFAPFIELTSKTMHIPHPFPLQLEQVIDRMMYRPVGSAPTAEMWHRDIAPGAQSGDIVFGGWINLDSTSQFFVCEPKTHNAVRPTDVINQTTSSLKQHAKKSLVTTKSVSFARGSVPKKVKKQKDGFATLEVWQYPSKKNQVKVEIPSGHFLVFNENLVHTVVAKKVSNVTRRVFLGWRVTSASNALLPDNAQLLMAQAAMPVKSLQTPTMYAKLHWTTWGERVHKWTVASLIPTMRVNRSYVHGTGKNKGVTHTVPRTPPPSLDELDVKYDAYTNDELSMHVPRCKWLLLKPETHDEYIEISLH